jgi:hypothetical protein
MVAPTQMTSRPPLFLGTARVLRAPAWGGFWAWALLWTDRTD